MTSFAKFDLIKYMIDNVERNYEAGNISEKEKDEAIDDILRDQTPSELRS